MRVEVIAECGISHNGSFDQAMRLVDAAKAAGADTVKFQQSVPELEVIEGAPVAEYQAKQGYHDQLQMIRSLMLTDAETIRLSSYCYSNHIEFLSTPADPVSLKFLVEQCGIKRIKIGSDNLNNPIMLMEAAKAKLPLIMSTGMATLTDIGIAVALICPSQFMLMQCTSAYPTEIDDANVAAIRTLRDTFRCPVGFSDHTIGPMAAMVAVGAGATMIEKHLTLDRSAKGPDHAMSMDPSQFGGFVNVVRDACRYMGHGIKEPTLEERDNALSVRKSLVAARDIAAGEEFSSENLTAKRPGYGRSPFDFYSLTGKPAQRAYKKDEMIR